MSFEDLLKSLQQDYINALPAKIEIIKKQVASKDVSEIRESFHKLKGTGRTYGLPEVSELAALVEAFCLAQSAHALTAAQHALVVLTEIHSARSKQQEFALTQSSAFQEIQKL